MVTGQFKRIHKRTIHRFDGPVYDALQAQIESFVKEYQRDQNARPWHLPYGDLPAILTDLHVSSGSKYAVIQSRDIAGQGVPYPSRFNIHPVQNKGWRAAMEYKRQILTAEEIYNQFIHDYLELTLLSKSVIPITETTKAFILRIISQGVEQGFGVEKIVRNLKDSELTKFRAQLIVRTETTKAMNTGAMFAAAASGVAIDKVWVSTQNIRTRRLPRDQFDHLNINGEQVGFGDAFIVPSKFGDVEMQYPGDPAGDAGNVINCRCTQIFRSIRDKDGELMKALDHDPKLASNPFYQIANNPLKQWEN